MENNIRSYITAKNNKKMWIWKDVDGSGRGLIYATAPKFIWRDWKSTEPQ
jgi:hypothetical protein